MISLFIATIIFTLLVFHKWEKEAQEEMDFIDFCERNNHIIKKINKNLCYCSKIRLFHIGQILCVEEDKE